ncbi:PHB depolymerase family esterase [Termitidicoccus mucosus]|uniref:Peptidase S9 prolyl oligopeptidase catalytic domain-containing protein n=1 Tax=Termitidicoccus mucosus TaxID=1184151 RepID=A0A178IIS0_9BACT|nr:hypothetical protein AW736_15115 [Opitutaceae bacterium TSB47]
MSWKITHSFNPLVSKTGRILAANICLVIFGISTLDAGDGREMTRWFEKTEIVSMDLGKGACEISKYNFLGSWDTDFKANGRNSWKDTVRLNYERDSARLKLTAREAGINGALPALLSLDAEDAYFNKISWKDSQVSAMAFRAISPQRQTAILEVDTDNRLAVYVNSKLVKELVPTENVELGINSLIPVPLEEGENMCFIKIVSPAGPPRLRMLMALDQSKDFQAAWNTTGGFLNKQIYAKASDREVPTLKWDDLLGRLAVSVEVHDMATGQIVLKKESLRSGSVLRNGLDYLGEGFYKISYKSNKDEAYEYFLVGSPRRVFEDMKNALAKFSWDDGAQLNIEAQIIRGKILLDKSNYDANNRAWQEKVVYTLGSLSELMKLRERNTGDYARDTPGLHIRGFTSEIDRSRQFYRLYIPSNYTRARGIPLMLIMPTAISARGRPFIESPFMASHRNAVQICRFAEKHGVGILWPGYRNAPEGWSYESVHAGEALRAVEKDYNIDASRISLYGICSGGFYAGRLVMKYPKRFAAIVYDRAIFDGKASIEKDSPGSLDEWLEAINPSGRVANNPGINIFVLNDGSRTEGHGEMKLSEEFLQAALPLRNDIKHLLGRRPTGVELWDMIFGWLAHCKNDGHDSAPANGLDESGYAGPISEIFSRPFIVVEGASSGPGGAFHIRAAMRLLSGMYNRQFYGADFIVKKDRDVTKDDLKTKSLILVGNPESNSVWKKLELGLPVKVGNGELAISGRPFSGESAFMAICRNPSNRENHILLVGAGDLRNLIFATNINPCRAWFDCGVIEMEGDRLKRGIIGKLGMPVSGEND